MNANDRALLVAIGKSASFMLKDFLKHPDRDNCLAELDDALQGVATDMEFGEHLDDMAADRERDARSYDEPVQPE